jgi:N-methylhydantoinase B/oxoprolinase/acetone carboxylase alpha subunit
MSKLDEQIKQITHSAFRHPDMQMDDIKALLAEFTEAMKAAVPEKYTENDYGLAPHEQPWNDAIDATHEALDKVIKEYLG